MPDTNDTSANYQASNITHLAANIYRVTINRLAIAVRITGNPDYPSDTPWRLTEAPWHAAAEPTYQAVQHYLTTAPFDPTHQQQASGLVSALAPYDRPDLDPDELQRWRDVDFALEDKRKAARSDGDAKPRKAEPSHSAHLLPLVEFYTGLMRIDKRVASMYDGKRYEKLMKICIGIGAVLLAITVATAVAQGLKDFDWGKVPLEGSLGIICGFALGLVLDYRRRTKTRAMIEEWGDKFGCDLKGMRWRQLPVFSDRVGQELTRLGGGYWVTLDQSAREAALEQAMQATGYQPVDGPGGA